MVGFGTLLSHLKVAVPLARLLKKCIPWAAGLLLIPGSVNAAPNGTWLSQPQIWFYASTHQLGQLMARIQAQRYRVVFLDYRRVPDEMQEQVTQAVRKQGLIPIVWIQSPQYRLRSVSEFVHEARHGDGLQVDDQFFAHYALQDFYQLRRLYPKPIFCSIQPSQVALAPTGGCNQLDVQCYAAQGFQDCVKLADRLGAVVSLSTVNTFSYQETLGIRRYNIFLWP